MRRVAYEVSAGAQWVAPIDPMQSTFRGTSDGVSPRCGMSEIGVAPAAQICAVTEIHD